MTETISYRFLSTGELEIPTRGGFKLIPGCSCRGIFEYRDRVAELFDLTQALEGGTSIQALYLENERFRWLCDRILTLNGIDPGWVRPADLDWLLFAHYDDAGQIQPSPLDRLNTPEKPRYPQRSKKAEIRHNDYISILAAIASQCGSIEQAVKVAESLPAKLVFGTLEDLSWSALSTKQKEDAKFDDWKERLQTQAAKGRPKFQRKEA